MENHYLTDLDALGENHYPSVQQLRRLFDSTLDVICSIDLNGKFQYVSNGAVHVWGYTPCELNGRNYMDLVIEEDQAQTRLMEEHIIHAHKITNFENRYKRKDGSVVPIAWTAQWDSLEKVMFCIARDVSERKAEENLRLRYEQEIRSQHQEMQNILERIDDGFMALDEFFTITYWNSHAAILLKKTREEVFGKNLWDCFPEAIGTTFYQKYTEALEQQVSIKFTAFFAPHTAWYEVSVYPSTKGLSVFFRDITEQKRTEEELRKLSLVAKETDYLIIVTDAQGKTTWVNDAFTRKTGYTLAELQGQYPGELLRGPDTDAATARFIQEQSERGQPFHVEIVNYTKSKEKYWVEISAQPVYNTEGALTHFFAIETDITERKRLQERLNEDIRQRQQLITTAVIKAQEQERAHVGQELHDNVNQVLTTVKLYQELCLSGINNSAELIRKSMNLLQNTIDEIRCLSKRLSAPTLGNIQLKESIKELVETITATNKISIDLIIGDIGDLSHDKDLHLTVYRILQEHLTNILKHAEAQKVQITLDLAEGVLKLLVIDDGCGFDPAQLRGGIGITNMMTRAESLNGTLQISSEPGKGCTLIALLPLAS